MSRKLPDWAEDLNGEWRAVETLEDFDTYEARRAELEKLVDGQFEFAYKKRDYGIVLHALVTRPYTVMVGLRPGPYDYFGKLVPTKKNLNTIT
jgi:hypothetical protein